jgi:ATP-dependent DNA helicase DinG
VSAFPLEAVFAADGPLSRELPGYAPRPVQLHMAEDVSAAFQNADLRLIEAGTGTGKTFAYLVPALLSGQRVAISTGTKNLQDQLFERDLPRVQRALRVPARVAMLKGRANYLCLHRLKRTAEGGAYRYDARFADIERWSRATVSGEVAELGAAAEDPVLRARITSTADNCLGAKCPDFNACHVAKARRAAMAADLVVINHHVLLADVVLKEEGFGEILPGVDAVIVDEAHQLPELVAQFFGLRVSTRQLRDLAEDSAEEAQACADLPDLAAAAEAMGPALQQLEAQLSLLSGRTTRRSWLERPGPVPALKVVAEALQDLAAALDRHAERNATLEALNDRVASRRAAWQQCVEADEESHHVHWVEPLGRGGVLHCTPINAGEGFRRMVAAHPGAWILTSATLSAAGDFGHFRRQLGLLDEVRELALDSPFDFREQARLLIPRDLPDPSAPEYSARVAELSRRLIEQAGGGAFVLCTSHRALRVVAEQLGKFLPYTMLVQGEDSRSRLVERFIADGDAVLVGTQSFWEGVDVRGRALRMVIIDKLPFAAPGDPVYDAKLEALRREGGNPFVDLQLPEAIMSLRQGAGRLIRDRDDRGLLVLCDPRLRQKSYGRKFLAALPDMLQVDFDAACDWLKTL